jgi:hypothetical protein
VHLSASAQTRVAKELLTFWASDPFAQTWFLAGDSKNPTAKPAATAPPSLAPPNRGKQAAADQPAWIVNGANKLPKLKRLVGENDFVRVVVRSLDGKVVAELNDVLNRHTDLNKVAGAGQFRLEFLDQDSRPIKLSQPVGDTVRLK